MSILFLGLGRVNLALAQVLSKNKSEVLWALDETDQGLKILKADHQGKFVEQKIQPGNLDAFDFTEINFSKVFISPGIDPRREFFKKIAEKEIRELDFFSENFKGTIIAITGTDGKSTFTFQMGEFLKKVFTQKKIFVGGNLGNAMVLALLDTYDLAVIEVSSYQTERLKSAEINTGIILNLDTDHLDRYDSESDYHQAKWNLLRFVKYPFYPSNRPPFVACGKSFAEYSNEDQIPLILEKVTKAIAQLWTDLRFEWKSELLVDLPRLPHRIQRFVDSKGRHIVNDSKATTVHAVIYALKQLQKEFSKVHLILGGQYKGDDFKRLKDVLRAEDLVFIYGQAKDVINEHLQFHQNRIVFKTLKELLSQAEKDLKKNDILVLSPGCSSFDEFEDFEDRGRFFVEFFGLKLN